MSIIRDIALYPSGREKIEWVRRHMPLLNRLEEEFKKEQPLKDLRITISIHLEAKTAYMAQVLRAGGAQVAVTGCNPLSTQDDIAAALVQEGMEVYAVHGASMEEYESHLCAALEQRPHQIIDDGGDLIHLLHGKMSHAMAELRGGAEETTTGVIRLRSRHAQGQLRVPILAVNDAQCKYLFDNRYGTGQSVWDAIMRTTNLLVAGKKVVVAGYGWCGRGIAMRAKALGAQVIICEVNSIKAIEAVMDGYQVMPMVQAAAVGDIFITATGCKEVINREAFACMQDDAILCNAGHFDVEVNKAQLQNMAVSVTRARNNIDTYILADGRRLNLLGEGRLVNLAAGDGHPAEIMDTSFALQLLCMRYIAEHYQELSCKVYDVPEELDGRVAAMKLESLGVAIDRLSLEQQAYLKSWEA